ncbi:MAG TPA: cytochrome b/b6 domain-containing protein [Sphingomicrobium sp.]|nr:cytochrome b/b6 domain-containing protein [Sphingomicrobium sp.]
MRDIRSHNARAIFHSVFAVLIIAMLVIGFFYLRPMSSTDPAKVTILGLHMIGGAAILMLLVARSTMRFPATGLPARRRFATIGHRVIYAVVALLLATGIATAVIARLPGIVFGSGGHLPQRFTIYPTFIAHTIFAELLTVLILGHIVAALVHQFILKDGLLALIANPFRSSESSARSG